MDVQVWSDVQVKVQSAKASAKTITAITNANPAVAACTAHGYSAGDLLLIRATGMIEADYLVCRMAAGIDADHFTLEGIDSTNFGTFTSGTAEKLTMGTVASTVTDVGAAGGEAEDIHTRTIHNSQDKSIPGNFSPVIFTLGNYWDPSDSALLAFRSYGHAKTRVGVEFIFSTGARVMFACVPSASLAPGGQAGQAVTTPAKLNLVGSLTPYST